MLRGLSNAQIAARVGTSENMIKNHFRAIMDVTGMDSRVEVALWAVNHL
jgi:DNA-binding NarL/FixJ family response regulator